MSSRDTTVAATVVVLGGAAAWQSALLPFGSVRSPGPGFFPWSASVLILGLSALLLVRALAAPAAHDGPRALHRGALKVTLLVGVLALYAALVEPLGYPLCTFLLVLFMLRVLDPHAWPVALGMALGTSAASYALFAIWLRVPLPWGALIP